MIFTLFSNRKQPYHGIDWNSVTAAKAAEQISEQRLTKNNSDN